jgi:hypothetical protein
MSLPLDLERLAIMRGCDYYERDLPPRVPPLGEVPLANAGLAVALISPSLRPTAREIRLAAALLATPDLHAEEVSAVAVQENCAAVVRYITLCGRRFEPENSFWQNLLELLPEILTDADNLPHPTRFVEMTGIDRGKVGLSTRWIRPRQPVAARAGRSTRSSGHDRITKFQLLEAFSQMKPIELGELREAFGRAKPIILKLALESSKR